MRVERHWEQGQLKDDAAAASAVHSQLWHLRNFTSASASSRSISATAPSEAWSMGPRAIERATARHSTVLGERRRLRELGHLLGLIPSYLPSAA